MGYNAIGGKPPILRGKVENMGRKVPAADIDKAVKLYLAGETANSAASMVGINPKTLLRALKDREIPIRPRAVEVPGAVKEYIAGDSVLEISTRHGVSRRVIDRLLSEAGISKRSASEQNRIAASRESIEERHARVASAHAAKRGKPPKEASMRRSAATRERNGKPESRGERRLLGWLEDRGEIPGVQTAIERYNIDISVFPIAMELLGGEWHRYKGTHAVRTKAILNAGWHVLFIWDTPMFPVSPECADYAVAFLQEARSDPSATREYRVIRGDGEYVAGGSLENYDLTAIPTARHGLSPSEAGRLGAQARWG
jgi:very-short-patch-repair endonuclease